MRITNNMVLRQACRDLTASRQRLTKLQMQVSSTKRILSPEDDPYGTQKAIGLRSALRLNQSHLRTLESGNGWMTVTEAAMGTIKSSVERAYVLALGAANDSLGDDERGYLAKEVEELIHQAVTAANTRYQNRYVFSGYQTGTPAFTLDEETFGVTYNGDDHEIELEIESGHTVVTNLPGSDAAFSESFTALQNFLTNLRTPGVGGDTFHANIDDLQQAEETLLQRTATIGARGRAMAEVDERLRGLDINLQEQLSQVEDLDMGEAAVRMMNQEVAYQALVQVAGRLTQPLLIEYVR